MSHILLQPLGALWALGIEYNRRESGDCLLEVPTNSYENQLTMCSFCIRNPSLQVPPDQRAVNHAESQARITRELRTEQEINAAIDQERMQEELDLSEVSSIMMTAVQAERIRFLYNSLVDSQTAGMESNYAIPVLRAQLMQRAMFNIPIRRMGDWTNQDLIAHSDDLIRDATARDEECRREFEVLDAIKLDLSLEECRTEVRRLLTVRRVLNKDYAKYVDLIILIHERIEQEERRRKVQARIQRSKAISDLLQPVLIDSLPDDESSQRFMIYMGKYGDANNSEQVELPSQLPCGHIYGTACISMWLIDNETCGLCRLDYKDQLSGSPPSPNDEPAGDVIPEVDSEEDEYDEEEMADYYSDGDGEGPMVWILPGI